MKLVLELTNREVELLRNSTSDLGTNDVDCTRLQLKIADAILDARPTNDCEFVIGQNVCALLDSGRTIFGEIVSITKDLAVCVAQSDVTYLVPVKNVSPLDFD